MAWVDLLLPISPLDGEMSRSDRGGIPDAVGLTRPLTFPVLLNCGRLFARTTAQHCLAVFFERDF
jgi:hypothetical protein